MHPILFQYGIFRLSTYGLMVATAFMVGMYYISHVTKKEGENTTLALDLCYYILLAAIIGSRLFYIIVNIDAYIDDPLAIFKIWQGGLVFYGGLIGSLAVSIWFVHKHRLNFFRLGDMIMPAVPLGHVFGRLGCFFAGCCYGRPAPGLPWAITFHDSHSLAPRGIPLHPTQLYESVTEFCVFLFLAWFRRHKKFDGQVFTLYLLIYPILRSINETFRGDIERRFLPIPGAPTLISTGQFTSLIIFAVALWLYLYLRKRSHNKTVTA